MMGDFVQYLEIPGRVPTANQFLGKGQHWTYNAAKSEWTKLIQVYIKKCKLRPMKWARFTFEWRDTNTERDPDNLTFLTKFILDALVDQRILKNDGWVEVLEIDHRFVVDRTEPGVQVMLKGEPAHPIAEFPAITARRGKS